MALLLAPVESPGMTGTRTCRVVVPTGQPKSSSTIESGTNQLPQGRSSGAKMASTGPLLPTRLNHEWSNFQTSLTFQSVCHDSTTFSNIQPHVMSVKPNRVRNRSLGTIHTSEQRSETVTTSAVLSITGRNELMLVEKQMSLSTKSRPITERISHTVRCQTLTAQMYGRSFEA